MKTGKSAALIVAVSACFGQNTASISGTVVNTKSAGVPGLIVMAHRTSLPTVTGRAKTGAGGAYQLTGLEAGNYRICVQSPDGGYVDPCEWTRTPDETYVKTGQAVARGKTTVQAGTQIPIQLVDAGHVLETEKNGVQPTVTLGVVTPGGAYRPAVLQGKTAQGRTHRLTIPADAKVKVRVSARNAVVVDRDGAEVGEKGSDYEASTTGNALVFVVKAVKP